VDTFLEGIEKNIDVDYFEDKVQWNAQVDKIVCTGRIDEYFGFKYGKFNYRYLKFETETFDTDNFQGNEVINYTDAEIPYTRILEHKLYEFGNQKKTVITK